MQYTIIQVTYSLKIMCIWFLNVFNKVIKRYTATVGDYLAFLNLFTSNRVIVGDLRRTIIQYVITRMSYYLLVYRNFIETV